MAAKLGFWIDHTQNYVLGAKITLTVEDGTLLIAGLTQLVTLAGAAAWVITAFSLHQIRSSSDPVDAMFLQEQVVLRNNTSPLGDIWQLLQMGWSWRRHAANPLRRVFKIIFFPLFLWVGFTVAGLFVSRTAAPGYNISTVLMKPGACGFLNVDTSTKDGFLTSSNKIANDTSQARAYAQKCYHSVLGAHGCSSFPVQAINYTTNAAATCPFNGSRCIGGSFGAYEMDSGWIDSHEHLGINAKPSHRVQVRMKNTCSVITYRDLVQIIPDSSTNGLSRFYQFFLGNIEGVSNYTFQYSTHSVNDLIAYTITSVYARAGVPGVFNVTSVLNRTDGDLSFHFFAPNSVTYFAPTSDPFFSASGNLTAADGNIAPDAFIHIMACMDQRQFRNPTSNASTLLTGLTKTGYPSLGLNTAQNATIERMFLALISSDTYNTVSGQNGAALQASSKLYQLFSPGLPNNQWHLELQGWFETGLAKLQQYVVDFVNNPSLAGSNGHISITTPVAWKESDSAALQSQCFQQRITSTGSYQTFSFLGIIIIAVVAPGIILLSLMLRWCVDKRGDRRNGQPNAVKRYAYTADGKLSLLKLALEGSGYSGWEERLTDVPVRDSTMGVIHPARLNDGNIDYQSVMELRSVNGNTRAVHGGDNLNGMRVHANESQERMSFPIGPEPEDNGRDEHASTIELQDRTGSRTV